MNFTLFRNVVFNSLVMHGSGCPLDPNLPTYWNRTDPQRDIMLDPDPRRTDADPEH
jgi:hypothetical protein